MHLKCKLELVYVCKYAHIHTTVVITCIHVTSIFLISVETKYKVTFPIKEAALIFRAMCEIMLLNTTLHSRNMQVK